MLRPTTPRLFPHPTLFRSHITAIGATKPHDPTWRLLAHGNDSRIIPVQNGYPARNESGNELRLGNDRVFDAAKFARVGETNHENDSDIEWGQGGQSGDVSDATCAKLQHQELGFVRELQHGQWRTHLIIE